MGRKKLSMSEKIRRYMASYPDAKPRMVAQALGADVKLVYYVKYHDKPKVKPAETNNVSPREERMRKLEQAAREVRMEPAPKPSEAAVALAMDAIDAVRKTDPVNHPAHYTDGGIEVIDFLQAKMTREEFIGYLKGNVLKYGSRLGKKGDPGVDAGKMAWYAAKLRDVMAVAS